MDHQAKGSEGPWPAGWVWSVVAAILAAIVARWLGDISTQAAVLLGLMVFMVFAVLLGQFWEAPASDDHDGAHDDHGHDNHGHGNHGNEALAVSLPVAVASKAEGMPAPVAAAPAPVTPAPFAAVPVASVLSAPATLAPLANGPVEPVPAPVAASPAEAAPAGVPAAMMPLKSENQSPSATSDTTASNTSVRPLALTQPRDGKADDLQVIEGIGPVLERLCHELGIFHFDQIAGWGPAEIAYMDGNIKGFKGRVTRDKWVAQARLIGAEGMQAFLIRAKTNDY